MLSCIYLAEGDRKSAERCIIMAREMNPRIPPTNTVFDYMYRFDLDWGRVYLTDM